MAIDSSRLNNSTYRCVAVLIIGAVFVTQCLLALTRSRSELNVRKSLEKWSRDDQNQRKSQETHSLFCILWTSSFNVRILVRFQVELGSCGHFCIKSARTQRVFGAERATDTFFQRGRSIAIDIQRRDRASKGQRRDRASKGYPRCFRVNIGCQWVNIQGE